MAWKSRNGSRTYHSDNHIGYIDIHLLERFHIREVKMGGYCTGCTTPRYYVGNDRKYCPKCGGPLIYGESAKGKAKALKSTYLIDIKLGIVWGG